MCLLPSGNSIIFISKQCSLIKQYYVKYGELNNGITWLYNPKFDQLQAIELVSQLKMRLYWDIASPLLFFVIHSNNLNYRRVAYDWDKNITCKPKAIYLPIGGGGPHKLQPHRTHSPCPRDSLMSSQSVSYCRIQSRVKQCIGGTSLPLACSPPFSLIVFVTHLYK